MHYTIDGYNLLFYLFGPLLQPDFSVKRDQLIQELNSKISLLALDVTVVFDSHLCSGEGSRSHFHHLEILFTPEGITADDFIIQTLGLVKDATKEIVVTNDRTLALRARHQLASTQGVEHFLNWLDRRYSNKKQGSSKPITRHKTKTQVLSPQSPLPPQPSPRPRPKLLALPQNKPVSNLKQSAEGSESSLPEGSLDYYLSIFQSAHEAILSEEQAARLARKLRNKANRKKR